MTYVKEIRDEFNPHATNITKNNVNLHIQSIFPVDNTTDSSNCICPVACGNKSKYNMINERTCIEIFNEACDTVNGKNTIVKRCGILFT